MSKHTPGPWSVILGYTSAPSGVQTINGNVIADVFSGDAQEPEDNANLIAAAPDLLEACDLAACQIYSLPDWLIAKLHAAIAKARGQS